MKKSVKRIIGLAVPAAVAVGLNRLYVKKRYGEKNAKPTFKFSEIAEGETEGVKLTAHRGLSAVAPENTAAAFKEAVKHPYYAVECDIYCTADNRWVVIHDYMLQSMAKEKGDVKKMSYAETLSKIKYNNGANIKDYPDAGICTLEEYIDICSPAGVKPMIEVKDKRVEKVKELYSIFCEKGIEKDVILISFHEPVLREFRRLDENMELWYLMQAITDEKLLDCIEQGYGVAFEAKRAARTPEMVQKIHDNSLTAACWTVDTPELLNKMLEMGVKYITTNAILPE